MTEPREYELALAIALLLGAAFLVARARTETDGLRRRALTERNRRLDAEGEVERYTRNMDGALETIQELNDRLARLERAGSSARAAGGARPDAAKPTGSARRPAAGS